MFKRLYNSITGTQSDMFYVWNRSLTTTHKSDGDNGIVSSSFHSFIENIQGFCSRDIYKNNKTCIANYCASGSLLFTSVNNLYSIY